MGDKIRRVLALAAVVVAFAGLASVPASAASKPPAPVSAMALSSCYLNSICGFNDYPTPPLGSVIMPNREVADANRNMCYPDLQWYGPETVTIVNRSNYRWYLFRTTDCGGSHRQIAPNTEWYTDSDWRHIKAWYRTSSTS